MTTIEKIRAEIERRRKNWLAASRLVKKGKDTAMYAAGKSSAYTEFLSFLDTIEEPVSDQEPSLEQLPYDNLMALYKSVQFEIRRRVDELTIHIEEKPYQK